MIINNDLILFKICVEIFGECKRVLQLKVKLKVTMAHVQRFFSLSLLFGKNLIMLFYLYDFHLFCE